MHDNAKQSLGTLATKVSSSGFAFLVIVENPWKKLNQPCGCLGNASYIVMSQES
jgi:hypothetical protein